MRRLIGVYGQFSADYKNWAFLNLTGRNDWSSTLPLDRNSYFCPSASLAMVFTDALGIQDHPFLSYGKVRLSLSKVGSDAPPYRLATTYSTASGAAASNGSQQFPCCGLSFPIPQDGGVNGYFQGNSLGNPDLKPETTVEKEVGLELRFFNGRARTDVSYYDKKSYDQIFSVPASPSTGFSSITRNAGDLRNKGWEVSLFGSPLRTQNFGWDMQVNWSRNRSSVLALSEGVTSIYLAGYSWPQIRIMEGYEYGVIWGYGYLRDEQGRRLIDDSGWPILDDELKVLGETQIDWHGSLNTSFRFRNFAVSTLIERRQGGDMLNFELQYTIPPGQAKLTENRGDTYVFEGVNQTTGQPNTVELERTEAFWRRFGAFDTHENMVEDATATRVRELTLQYTLPRETAQRFHLQSLQVYATGRNLKIWTKNSNGDPAGSVYGSDNAGGQYYRFFPAPQTRGWYVGLRTGF
jgi:outer membrane receptor protein involved in Fe transport